MGATYFEVRVKAESADSAFKQAQEQAFYDHGHSGYTGTIAEKDGYIMMAVNGTETVEQAMERLDDSEVVNNKWGPAACIEVNLGEYVFFGWASA
jgi:hypothetical protein